jgi:hypothetical protein
MHGHFLFEPGEWLGAGQVSFSVSPDILHFRTKWVVTQVDKNRFHSTQTVEIVGGDRIVNIFEVIPQDKGNFDIVLDNELLGTFKGKGIIEDHLVAWEFREKGTFEGYELYKKVNETEYTLHAEYLSSDQARTLIRGRIWKRLPRYEDEAEEERLS